MKREPHHAVHVHASPPRRFFPTLFGTFLGLTLLKFSNPPIMEKWVSPPADVYEFLLGSPWPIVWAFALLGLVAVVGLRHIRLEWPSSSWPLALLLVWLTWQFVSAVKTVDVELTGPTLAHFVACAGCYFLGCFCLSSSARLEPWLAGLVIAYLLVLAIGFQQQFGGLEQTRRHFFLYIYPELKEVSPEYLKKISSPRIFSTLFYPNALAGVLLLLLPSVLVTLAQAKRLFTPGARWFLVATVGTASLACLVWSGSKGGWLIMLFLGLLALLRFRFARWLKIGLVALALILGVTGFGLRYRSFFERGATSVVARFDYWSAAIRTAGNHPWVGTGPGTFSKPFQALKRPESEMARLAHNDYLQQASDSGWPGFVAFMGFVGASLIGAYPRRSVEHPATLDAALKRLPDRPDDWLRFALWLGALGWAMQGLFEFGLYIPALAWPAFSFLGVLVACRGLPPGKRLDKSGLPQ